MIALLDHDIDVKVIQTFKKEDSFKDDCFECQSYGYFYVYKNSNDYVEGSGTGFSFVTLNGKPVKHSDLYKILLREEKLKRICGSRIGDIVECINNEDAGGLTLGKKYKILGFDWFQDPYLIDDDGGQNGFMKSRFKSVTREQKLKRILCNLD